MDLLITQELKNKIDVLLGRNNFFEFDSNLNLSEIEFAELTGKIQFLKVNYPQDNLYNKYNEIFQYGHPQYDKPENMGKPINGTTSTKCGGCGGGKVL